MNQWVLLRELVSAYVPDMPSTVDNQASQLKWWLWQIALRVLKEITILADGNLEELKRLITYAPFTNSAPESRSLLPS